MGWLRLVGSIKLQVSFAEYRLFYRALLQKRSMILSILLTKATVYWAGDQTHPHRHTYTRTHTHTFSLFLSHTHTCDRCLTGWRNWHNDLQIRPIHAHTPSLSCALSLSHTHTHMWQALDGLEKLAEAFSAAQRAHELLPSVPPPFPPHAHYPPPGGVTVL